MKRVVFASNLLFLSSIAFCSNGKLISQKEYIDAWKAEAIMQMQAYKIPASITMAQAILESSSGNSTLAREGKNHFGIKCHDWNGKTMSLDDDKPNECFRVYSKVEDSYKDHSLFLRNHKRYAALFQLEITDYASWANGLKSAGYATNPKYAELLIQLIEKQNLAVLDGSSVPVSFNEALSTTKSSVKEMHQVFHHQNKVNYIIAQKGDTYVRIAKEFNLGLWQLYKYNDFSPRKEMLEVGDVVFVQPKRKRSKLREFTISKEMSLRQISQENAIYLSRLKRLNATFNEDSMIPKGTKISLR
jgi:uncharacterized FlgJ-related protein